MSETVSATSPRLSLSLMITAAAAGALFAATAALWAHYGTAVLYEMIVAGIAGVLLKTCKGLPNGRRLPP